MRGTISAANSLVGSTAEDQVGSDRATALPGGGYVVTTPGWDRGAVLSAGAVTWGSAAGIRGTINSENSALGSVAFTQLASNVAIDNVNGTFYAAFLFEGGGAVRAGSQHNGFQPAPVIGSFGGALSFWAAPAVPSLGPDQ